MVGQQVLVLSIGVRISASELCAGVLLIGVRIPVLEPKLILKFAEILKKWYNVDKLIEILDKK